MGSQRTERPPEWKTRPHVPEHCRVYAIGDIHGRLDLLRRLHGKILEDAAKGAPERQVIVYVGDYIDRGPDSFGVIEALLNEPLPGFEHHYLKGNHEDFMLRFLDDSTDGDAWMMNGGLETLNSYGVTPKGAFFDPGELESLRRALEAAVPETHLDFLTHLALYHIEGNYLFVHAGIRPGVALADQNEHDLIWIRDGFLDYEGSFGGDPGLIVVHGHSVRSKPEIRDNRIGIDTGAGYSGRLTALVLEADTRRFLQT